MIEVSPLVGLKALKAFQAFNRLLLGLKMLPAYIEEPYEQFYEAFLDKTDGEKETFLREALAFVDLEPFEVEAFASFAKDGNGIHYTPANLKNLKFDQIFEIVVAVGMEIGRIRVDLVSDSEKKNSQTSP